jgi:hypothetical protein
VANPVRDHLVPGGHRNSGATAPNQKKETDSSMKQIFCLLTEGKAQFVLVDGSQLDQFAEVKVPAHYGLGELAALGANLAESLNLNGDSKLSQRNPIKRSPSVASKRKAAPAPTQKRRALTNIAERYITVGEIRDVLAQHPEGMTVRELAVEIAGTDPPPAWVKTAVNNRDLTAAAKVKRGEPMPWRTEYREVPNKGGGTRDVKYWLPMPSYLEQ